MLTPSETVYFHPQPFAREKALLDAAKLVHTETKYDASELADAILATAVLAAEEAGEVQLAIGKTGRLFGLRKVDAVRVSPGPKQGAFPAGSLEAAVRAAASGEPDAERVFAALLEEDAPDPHAWTLRLVERGLAKRGLLEVEQQKALGLFRMQVYKLPPGTRDLALRATPADAQRLLDRARSERPDVWKLLQEGLKRAVSSRTESSSDGPD